MKSRRSIKKRFYALLIVVFVMWIVAANTVIRLIDHENQAIEKIKMSNYLEAANVHCYIDSVESKAGLFEAFSVQGWAFVEEESITSNDKTILILSNDENCYGGEFIREKSQWVLYSRGDVVTAFDDMEFSTDQVGMFSDFSSYNMKEGVYDIYVYCYSETGRYGLGRSAQKLVKDENGVYLQ